LEVTSVISLLTLGFGLGLIHALDADHIMAVSSLSMTSGGTPWDLKRILGFCLLWALGHGAVLLSLTLLFVVLGFNLPSIIPYVAEKIIGVLLIVIGSWIIFSLFTQKITLRLHSHNSLTHFHITQTGNRQHNHQPVLIGITHGVAGSAPVLALVPAVTQDSLKLSVFYVLLFSLGVLLSMLAFGFFMGHLQKWIAGFGQRLFQVSQAMVAALAIGIGGYWLGS
jgi:nickel/cobalt exporter